MNTLLLNRDGFQMPTDGWYQVAPLGEFAHAGAGVVQVVDQEACAAMVNRFAADAAAANFAGLLVDFDHFSLDGEKRSEAAGWITALEARCPRSEVGDPRSEGGEGKADVGNRTSDVGLWAQIRWSDLGEEAVKGGRYRFLSPVWSRSDCQDLENGRVRPVRLLNAAVTNDPNLKGMRPLSNNARSAGGGDVSHRVTTGTVGAKIANAVAARFKWVLSGDGKHCPSCAAVAGQVHTMAEWDAAGIRPGGGALYCLGKCKCRLVATDEASTGVVTGVVKRHRPVGNAGTRGPRSEVGGPRLENVNVQQSTSNSQRRTEAEAAVREAKRVARAEMLANQGWTDEARAASLTVRRAKAEARERLEAGTEKKKGRAYTRPELGRLFQEVGYDAMTPGQIDNFAEFIRQGMREGKGPNAVEREFLQGYSEQNVPGIGRRDPVFQWCETQRRADQAMKEAVGMNTFTAAKRAAEIDERIKKGLGYTPEEGEFYVKWKTACQFFTVRERQRERANKDKKHWEPLPTDLLAVLFGFDTANGRRIKDGRYVKKEGYVREKEMENRWSDTARAASLAVRKAKAAARKQKKDGKAAGKDGAVRAINPDAGKGPEPDTGIYLGGSKYFDEATGRYVWPKNKRRWEK